MESRNDNMPEKLKDRTECGRFWSISRCMFGKNWNQTKEELLNGNYMGNLLKNSQTSVDKTQGLNDMELKR